MRSKRGKKQLQTFRIIVIFTKILCEMTIRRAVAEDLAGVNKLLFEVEDIHRQGRPDIFKKGAKKYSDEQLLKIFEDGKSPVFVAADEYDNVIGYAFCQIRDNEGEQALNDFKTLFIDDLCVDESERGNHIGKALYKYVLDFAKGIRCHNVTLHVWECNPSALSFYEKMGMRPMSHTMETVLDKQPIF